MLAVPESAPVIDEPKLTTAAPESPDVGVVQPLPLVMVLIVYVEAVAGVTVKVYGEELTPVTVTGVPFV